MIQERIDAWLAPFHRWQTVQFTRLARTQAQWGPPAIGLLVIALLGTIGYMDDDRIYPVCLGRDYSDQIFIKDAMTAEFSAAYFEYLGGGVRREYPDGGRLFHAGASFEIEDLEKATMYALRDVLERRFGEGTVDMDWGRSKLPGSDQWISNCVLLPRYAIVGGGGLSKGESTPHLSKH
jgi:hypothetical protein